MFGDAEKKNFVIEGSRRLNVRKLMMDGRLLVGDLYNKSKKKENEKKKEKETEG